MTIIPSMAVRPPDEKKRLTGALLVSWAKRNDFRVKRNA